MSTGESGESDPNYNGKLQVMVTRGNGIYGDISVSWSITPRDESAFLQVEGILNIADLQQTAAITIQVQKDVYCITLKVWGGKNETIPRTD